MMHYDGVHILRKLNAPESKAVLDAEHVVLQVLDRVGIPVIETKSGLTKDSLVIALGGDGTMLQAMHLSARYGSAAFGINLGNIGFLTELSMQVDVIRKLEDLVLGVNQTLEERTMLYVEGGAKGHCSFMGDAVNEVSVTGTFADAMITYRLVINDQDAGVHRANSLLVSTATGSTAYSLAAGGAIMHPSLDAVQIVPVAPARLTSRPIICPADSKIYIEAWNCVGTVRTDGLQTWDNYQRIRYTEDRVLHLEVTKKSKSARIVHFDGWNFFDMLQQKLGWMNS